MDLFRFLLRNFERAGFPHMTLKKERRRNRWEMSDYPQLLSRSRLNLFIYIGKMTKVIAKSDYIDLQGGAVVSIVRLFCGRATSARHDAVFSLSRFLPPAPSLSCV